MYTLAEERKCIAQALAHPSRVLTLPAENACNVTVPLLHSCLGPILMMHGMRAARHRSGP